jgi:hypothetical protein
MKSNLFFVVLLSCLAIIGGRVSAQKFINDEFLKGAMRSSVPPAARCSVGNFGPWCLLETPAGKLFLFKKEEVQMQVEFISRTEELKSFFDSLNKFGSKFGFVEKDVEGCFVQAIAKFSERRNKPASSDFWGSFPGAAWKTEETAVINNKDFKILCRMSRPEDKFRLEGMVVINNEF